MEQELGLSTRRAGSHVLLWVSLSAVLSKAQLLTKHDQLSESKIGVSKVNVQHRATDESLDP